MTEAVSNPWVERFYPHLDSAQIRSLAVVRPAALKGLRAFSRERACGQLHQALKAAFYPNSQCMGLLQRWLNIALEHSQDNYIGHADYYGRLHQKDVEFRRGTSAMCLTGLAGIGKSELLRALGRVMPSARRIVTKDGMQVPLESYRLLKLEVCANPNDLLRKFCGVRGTGDELKKPAADLHSGMAFHLFWPMSFSSLPYRVGPVPKSPKCYCHSIPLEFLWFILQTSACCTPLDSVINRSYSG